MTVAALFVRRDSHYKAMDGVDCYDEDRDARTWRGGCPGIFHLPCRLWSRLSHFVNNPADHERELALWSVSMARRFGGVVEHPKDSRLWAEIGCLTPGVRDRFGGVLITVNQGDFGHCAPKATGLYLVGTPTPNTPFALQEAQGRIERICRQKRERTPEAFALFLVDLARQATGFKPPVCDRHACWLEECLMCTDGAIARNCSRVAIW
jgi:hypothetical protein